MERIEELIAEYNAGSLRANERSKAIEDAVVKTVAGFLNTDGGTLLIGIGPDREVVGLQADYQRVKPPNGGRLRELAHHPSRRRRRSRSRNADQSQDRGLVWQGDLPAGRRTVLPAGLGQDKQGGAGVLRAHEQLHPIFAGRSDRALPRGLLVLV